MNVYAFAGEFLGGLIATYLFSRAIFWILRKYERSLEILAAAHLLALMMVTMLSAVSDSFVGGGVDIVGRLAAYTLPQIVWFSVDVLRQARKISPAS